MRPQFVRNLVLAALILTIPLSALAEQAPQAKYVFLFIGDGMGLSQRTAGELYLNAVNPPEPGQPQKKLIMNSFPVMGLTTTHCANSLITDSAASATALATGYKTDNGMLGLSPDKTMLYPTIAEIAKQHGYKVGIVTTMSIDHATPAGFYAHQSGRGDYYDIAVQLPASGMDYFAGSIPAGKKGPNEGDPNPIDLAREAGYTVVESREDLNALSNDAGKVWAMEEVRSEIDLEGEMPLVAFTRKGIELLDNPNGFFMMIESGQIDSHCHIHDAAATVQEVLGLDNAIAVAMDFYRQHPDETLIIVTADHETGGMTLGSTGAAKYDLLLGELQKQKASGWMLQEHVKKWRQAGTAFEDALPVIEAMFGLTNLNDKELAKLQKAYALSMENLSPKGRDEYTYTLYAGSDPLAVTCRHVVGLRAGIGWTTYSHTGTPVPTSAIGAGCNLFGGYHDNTDIPRNILKAMGLDPSELKPIPVATQANEPAVAASAY
jgi:alkaline phosphatase